MRSILNRTVPISSKNWVIALLLSGLVMRSRLLGETTTYSRPRTRTARPFLPVETTSPERRLPPATAIDDTPARRMCTLPVLSERVHDGDSALAVAPTASAMIAAIFATFFTLNLRIKFRPRRKY